MDSALQDENYDNMAPILQKRTITGYLPDTLNKKNKIPIKFVNEKSVNLGRNKAADIIRNKPGLSAYSRNAKSHKEVFSLFLTDDMLLKIVDYTNLRIRNTISKAEAIIQQSDKFPYMKITDVKEINAFIGLIYYRGLYSLNNHKVSHLFSERYGIPKFNACMSRNRFKFLLNHIAFDNFEDREERWEHDRFSAIREFFEHCNENFAKSLVPEDYLSLDETLYPMRTQIGFKQYNPDKPAKYGILFKSINSARYPYTHQTHVYCGKPVDEPTEHYVSGTYNYITYLVDKLCHHQNLCGRNISMDRLYTSFQISEWLLDKKITMVGTMQQNRVGIPPELKTIDNRECLSYELFWEENGKRNLSSYVVKTSSGKKNVIVLSTVEPIQGVSKDENKKPAIYKLYDFTKGGTDIVDQKMGSYTCKAKSRKWSMVAFYYLLDTIRVNSNTVYNIANNVPKNKQNSFEFGVELCDSLMIPFIKQRPKNGLSKSIVQKINLALQDYGKDVEDENPDSINFEKNMETRKRCYLCLEKISGANQKSSKNKLPKNKSCCQKCGKATCTEHVYYICKCCYES